jgi:protein involved in polysaccharide export with SLBB domain
MFIGLEVKTPTGKATELQMKMQEAIIKAGGIYEFVTSVEEVRNIIQGRI